MKTTVKKALLSVVLFFVASVSFAQNRPATGKVGLTASLQGGQTNLQLPIWVTDNVSIAPVFGINYQQDNFTSLNIGVHPRFFQDLGNDFGSYIGARGIVRYTSPEIGSDDTDIVIGPTGGGKYFFSEHFSAGVEGQFNFLVNDNGSNSITTGAAIMGTYYF